MEDLTDGELKQTRAALLDRQNIAPDPPEAQCNIDIRRAIEKCQEELRSRGVDYGY